MSEAHVVARSASGEASDSANDSPNQIEVDAILPVTPGKVYRASEVNWKGNSTLPAEQLQGLLHLKVGQPVDAVRLTSDLEGVVKLYHRHGLMRAHVTSEPQFDDEHATVRYEITVTEGEQFLQGPHPGSVDVARRSALQRGLRPGVSAKESPRAAG